MYCGISKGKYMKIYSFCIAGVLDVKRTAESWLFPQNLTVSRDTCLNASYSFYDFTRFIHWHWVAGIVLNAK